MTFGPLKPFIKSHQRFYKTRLHRSSLYAWGKQKTDLGALVIAIDVPQSEEQEEKMGDFLQWDFSGLRMRFERFER